jgi:hypothetical protein
MNDWDERKRARTLKERGLDFADAEKVFRGNILRIWMSGVTMANYATLPLVIWMHALSSSSDAAQCRSADYFHEVRT